MVWKDPVVEEVRAAGRELEARAGGDVHKFFENLRRVQPQLDQRRARNIATVRSSKRRKSRTAS